MPGAFEDWYKAIPIVTRGFMTICFLTTMAVHLDLVTVFDLYLNFGAITRQHEYWRILTNFFFFDYFGINFVFHMFFMVRHSKLLEETSFRGRTADYFFMYLFGAFLLLIIDYVMYQFPALPKVMFLAPSLSFMSVYVWARRNPGVPMNFLELLTFQAPYLPWVILGFGVLLGQSPVYDILGIIVGHIYYFLEDVYPQTTGRRLLKTPGFIKAIFSENAPNIQAQPQGRPWGEGEQVDPNFNPAANDLHED